MHSWTLWQGAIVPGCSASTYDLPQSGYDWSQRREGCQAADEAAQMTVPDFTTPPCEARHCNHHLLSTLCASAVVFFEVLLHNA